MKLKPMAIYGQRWDSWKNELLGYNTNSYYSIGNFGCLITAYGCYIGKNPHDVNELLKANGGFTAGSGNFIWSKCTVLGLNETYSSPTYDGPVSTQGINKLKEVLDAGYPAVCEVDFNQNTVQVEMHWVLVIGYEGENFYAVDPWTGMEINLEVYGGAKRAIIRYKAYDKTLPKEDEQNINCQKELDTVRAERDRNWNYFTRLCDVMNCSHDIDIAVAEEEKLVGIEDDYINKSKKLEEAQQKIEELEQKITNISFNQTELISENQTLQQKLNDSQKRIDDMGQDISSLSTSLQDLKKKLANGGTGWQLILLGIQKLLKGGD